MRVTLAPGAFLQRVTLTIRGLLPPTASAQVLVQNPTAAPLAFDGGTYTIRSDGRALVSGPLRVPATLAAGASAPITVDVGPVTALGATVGLGGVVLGGGRTLTMHAEVTVRLHDVRAVVVTSRAIGL